MTVAQKICTLDLDLGDHIKLFEYGQAYETYLVIRLEYGLVHLRRPYMTHSNFSYTGGIVWSVGIEECTIRRSVDSIVWLMRKSTLPEKEKVRPKPAD